MTDENRIATTVYLSKDQLETLKVLAYRGATSRAALLRDAVDDFFRKYAASISAARFVHDSRIDGPLYLASVSKRRVPKKRLARKGH